MIQNQDKLFKQNQKELENQLQNDLNALRKIEKWTKKIQERIDSNRQKLDQLKNNLFDNGKFDSTDKSPLFKTYLNATNNLNNKKNDKTDIRL
ncbi:unnamed protein product [Brachionus calyciflorus]|uniref:Uncharacterized protein n=1 Tax=Brachionus calyciflorus TaxID=104777 RepID=A0A814F5N6_9BILA|nr:unnamed protein product [Brachionus calyciflorus]